MTVYGDVNNKDLIIECNYCEAECWRLTDLSDYIYPQAFAKPHQVICEKCIKKIIRGDLYLK